MGAILQVKNLHVDFYGDKGCFKAVNNINFDLEKSKITCLVGRSGSGKSMTALSIIRRIPNGGNITGEIFFRGENLLNISEQKMNAIRGKYIFSIFQHPMNSFNFSVKIGKQLFQLAKSHGVESRKIFYKQMADILETLNFTDPFSILNSYPFQVSGGMLQRLVLAMAIYMKPAVIIADEPTTALDAAVQKEVLQQLKKVRDQFGVSIFLITHHFGVVAEIADDVIVMKEGMIVEKGNVFQIFDNPQHPYTKSLLQASFEKEVHPYVDGSA